MNGNIVKELNLNKVRGILQKHGIATKPQLAEATSLSVVTINSLVKELLARGEVYEDKTVPSNGGRPALTYRFNYNYSLALVLLFNENHWKDEVVASIVNLNGDTLKREEHQIPVFDLHHFEQIIAELINAYPAVKMIGIGIPGQVVNGEITVSSHETLKGIRMADSIQETFGLPVLIENDVNAAVSGYFASEDKGQSDCVIGIYFPDKYPPGVGIHLNGSVVKGRNGMAGEIKFLPMDVDWTGHWNPTEFIKVTCHVIQTLNAVLAPDKIVFYQNVVSDEEWISSWNTYQNEHEMASVPQVILSRSFSKDFHEGIQALALEELNPPIIK
ncbi:ROK family protein [Alkalicoccobacillus murimartini]|uniref:Transcriptional regulator n=1 Tax=Alkalicoccobacillus murimartini TaxID=171685 RepID=A0ABT9YJD0_9BACI|nr:ROK family protein [Alkalicoccobacillus murimartini]MDQ0207312.1 putative transcriptional regulator [Alkalicoccobacillus murimartini]